MLLRSPALVVALFALAHCAAAPEHPVALAHVPTLAAPDVRGRFAGAFAYAGGAPERAALDAAIDAVTDGMFLLARGIARGRLRDGNPVYDRVEFAFPPGRIRVLTTPGVSVEVRDDGTPERFPMHGEHVATALYFQGERLLETLGTAEGQRTNEFTLSGDGRTLTMSVTIHAAALPHDLRYALTYVRR